jgi:hypothetical protein
MTATILRFPGFLLADDGRGLWKDVRCHSSVDALMESLPERERCRMLDWNWRRGKYYWGPFCEKFRPRCGFGLNR